MKQNSVSSTIERRLGDEPEFPSFPVRRREVEPEPPPKWKNLTLDEMKTWLEEAKRLDREQNEIGASAFGS